MIYADAYAFGSPIAANTSNFSETLCIDLNHRFIHWFYDEQKSRSLPPERQRERSALLQLLLDYLQFRRATQGRP